MFYNVLAKHINNLERVHLSNMWRCLIYMYRDTQLQVFLALFYMVPPPRRICGEFQLICAPLIYEYFVCQCILSMRVIGLKKMNIMTSDIIHIYNHILA